jgi:hypothetical protein
MRQALTELAAARLARGDPEPAAEAAERAYALLDRAGYRLARDLAADVRDRALARGIR